MQLNGLLGNYKLAIMYGDDISEKQWNRLMVHFNREDDSDSETISVLRQCPKCCKIIPSGQLFMNPVGEVKLKNWRCNTHGEIEPYFTCY